MASPPEAGGGPPEEPEPAGATAPGTPQEPEPAGAPAPGTPQEPEPAERLMAQVATETARAAGATAPGTPGETLRRLEQRLDRASEAAERLMAQVATETARAAGATGAGNPHPHDANPDSDNDAPFQPPPAGWQSPEDEPPRLAPELDPFLALLHTVRDLIPPELQQRLIAALREVLLALRALIDWYLERMDRRRDQGDEVQDIPIL
ncbi:MAG TPA: hypothetical protein VMJ65_12530 [Solirubrobacteraceae bacterium]|nr:hypothetical protein [Solirubrobacteraceae bacterium]